jgi:hypothetical protein
MYGFYLHHELFFTNFPMSNFSTLTPVIVAQVNGCKVDLNIAPPKGKTRAGTAAMLLFAGAEFHYL